VPFHVESFVLPDRAASFAVGVAHTRAEAFACTDKEVIVVRPIDSRASA
jgi:hypothetical protein